MLVAFEPITTNMMMMTTTTTTMIMVMMMVMNVVCNGAVDEDEGQSNWRER